MNLKISDKPQKQLEVEIEIISDMMWNYLYTSVGGIYFKNGKLKNPGKQTYSLGKTDDLIDFDNNWEVIFTNNKDKELDYEINIKWIIDGKQVNDTWSRKSSIKPIGDSIAIRDFINFI